MSDNVYTVAWIHSLRIEGSCSLYEKCQSESVWNSLAINAANCVPGKSFCIWQIDNEDLIMNEIWWLHVQLMCTFLWNKTMSEYTRNGSVILHFPLFYVLFWCGIYLIFAMALWYSQLGSSIDSCWSLSLRSGLELIKFIEINL